MKKIISLVLAMMMVFSCFSASFVSNAATVNDIRYTATKPTLGNAIIKSEWPAFTAFKENANKNNAAYSMQWDSEKLYLAIDTDDKTIEKGSWGAGDGIVAMFNFATDYETQVSNLNTGAFRYSYRLNFYRQEDGSWDIDPGMCNSDEYAPFRGDSAKVIVTGENANIKVYGVTDANGDSQFIAEIDWSVFGIEYTVGDDLPFTYGFYYTWWDSSYSGGKVYANTYWTREHGLLTGKGVENTVTKEADIPLPTTSELTSPEFKTSGFYLNEGLDFGDKLDPNKWPLFRQFSINNEGTRNFYSLCWNSEGINIALLTSDRTVNQYRTAAEYESLWWKFSRDSIYLQVDPLYEGIKEGTEGYGEGTMHALRMVICRIGENSWVPYVPGSRVNGSLVASGEEMSEYINVVTNKRADGYYEYQIQLKWGLFGITNIPSVDNRDTAGITVGYADGSALVSAWSLSDGNKGMFAPQKNEYIDSRIYHNITINSVGDGRVAPRGEQRVADGEDFPIRLLPDDGFEIDEILVDGDAVEFDPEDIIFTLENVTEDHTVDVTFSKIGGEEELDFNCSDNIGSGSVEGNEIYLGVADGATVELEIFKGDNVFELYADPGLTKKIGRLINMSEQVIRVYAVNGDEVYTVALSKAITEYDFADLKEGAWYLPYVKTATDLGIIKGSEVDGKTLLKPEDKATRIEGIIFALRMLGIDSKSFSDVSINFADYNAEGEWSANYVKAAVALGLMKGSEVDGKLYLNGNNSISRQEFFAIFSRAMQITDKSEDYKATDLSKFVDKDKIATWFVDNIKYLVNAKIVEGNPVDGGYVINPTGDILRCEIIKMVTAALS